MADDVLLNKAARIERCLARIEQEYRGHEGELEKNFTQQDTVVLNLQRACQACIDMAMHKVRSRRLGLPQESRDAFRLLHGAGLIDESLDAAMQAMVGFRDVAVHDYRKLSIDVVRAILEEHLDDFQAFSRTMIQLEE